MQLWNLKVNPNFNVGARVGAGVGLAVSLALLAWWWITYDSKPKSGGRTDNGNTSSYSHTKVTPRIIHSDGIILNKRKNIFSEYQSFFELFECQVNKTGSIRCIGNRTNKHDDYQWLTYQEVYNLAVDLGAGLQYLGIKPGNKTNVVVYSHNRPEFVICQLACFAYGICTVPVHKSNDADFCCHIINQAEAVAVICDTDDRLMNILNRRSSVPNLHFLISMTQWTPESDQLARLASIEIHSMAYLEKMGKLNPKEIKSGNADDLHSIYFTSGSTGMPLGSLLTNNNIMSTLTSIHSLLEELSVSVGDILISYLPQAHIYESMIEMYALCLGAAVGFSKMKFLMEDILVLHPTIIPTIPYLLNTLYGKAMEQTKKSLVPLSVREWALHSKETQLRTRGFVDANTMWDHYLFKDLQDTLGGHCRIIVIGSAQIDPDVLKFIRVASGAAVVQGYGLTECAGVCTMWLKGLSWPGSVGVPINCCDIQLINVPELGFTAQRALGEVCVRGSNVFVGYHQMTEKTTEVLDSEGWLRTGDIGRFNQDGTLTIVDRKKDVFKLAVGEYIAPAKLEQIYLNCPALSQLFIYGDASKCALVAVAVPDKDKVFSWLELQRVPVHYQDTVNICSRKEVKAAILKEFHLRAALAGLKWYEHVMNIFLQPKKFSVENGLITETLKLKRHALQKEFAREISEMYTELDTFTMEQVTEGMRDRRRSTSNLRLLDPREEVVV